VKTEEKQIIQELLQIAKGEKNLNLHSNEIAQILYQRKLRYGTIKKLQIADSIPQSATFLSPDDMTERTARFDELVKWLWHIEKKS